MLVLSRKKEEAILIGHSIRIRYLGTAKGRVKLGIEAPRELGVARLELVRENLIKDQVIDSSDHYTDDEIFKIVQDMNFNWVKG